MGLVSEVLGLACVAYSLIGTSADGIIVLQVPPGAFWGGILGILKEIIGNAG